MPSQRSLFLQHVAQTSPWPMVIEIERAEGMYLYDTSGKRYLDFDSGFSVSSLGHRHPVVIKALEDQMAKYLHTTVYGEHIQAPQIRFALKLEESLGSNYGTVYYTNSGSEAVEVALKAGRKITGRYRALSCKNAYHGSTLGAESLRSDITYTSALMPGVPGIDHIGFNCWEDLDKIDSGIGILIMEVVQAEAGVILPDAAWLAAVRDRCTHHGCLLAFDEIQTGFGRTGKLFAHQQYHVFPDLLIMAKAMGGGMPVGAVAGSKQLMHCFSDRPALGHITTFGGHPMSLAASVAVLEFMTQSGIMDAVEDKVDLFKKELSHPGIKEIRSAGLLMAVTLHNTAALGSVVSGLLEAGVMVDYFLFNTDSFRIAPPLIAEPDHIREGCALIRQVLDKVIM
ncbi:MAG TPA: aspartate aminotransferase family protein [Saprospiraceae bacterium]|nr:aspartate aminotransferase family protein [Saprospiraceae bacterium]